MVSKHFSPRAEDFNFLPEPRITNTSKAVCCSVTVIGNQFESLLEVVITDFLQLRKIFRQNLSHFCFQVRVSRAN